MDLIGFNELLCESDFCRKVQTKIFFQSPQESQHKNLIVPAFLNGSESFDFIRFQSNFIGKIYVNLKNSINLTQKRRKKFNKICKKCKIEIFFIDFCFIFLLNESNFSVVPGHSCYFLSINA